MSPQSSAKAFLVDDFDVDTFTPVASGFGQDRYGYVVTPNTDHLIRWHQDATFREYYRDSSYVLLDSQFLGLLFRAMNRSHVSVCPGSDLTERLLAHVIAPNDPVVLIGAEEWQARKLEVRYGLRNLHHFNPPRGFAGDPRAVDQCLAFIERHSPFRFCLLAVGAPRQEMLAQSLRARGVACGLALCIGASIDFLTGKERRAPKWMRHLGFEWLFRLINHPRRLAHRYLIRGPHIFTLIPHTHLTMRPPAAPGVR